MRKTQYITTAALVFTLIAAISDVKKTVAVVVCVLVSGQFIFTIRKDAKRGFFDPDPLPPPIIEAMSAEEHAEAIRNAAAVFELERREAIRLSEERRQGEREAAKRDRLDALGSETIALDFDISSDPKEGFSENNETEQAFFQKRIK